MTKLSARSTLVIASHNTHKVSEIGHFLAPFNLHLVSAVHLDLEEPEETEDTFEGNALLKARACAIKTGFPSLADDSGLVVPALDGKPGIYSARWCIRPDGIKDVHYGIQKLKDGLANTTDRNALFVCVLSIVWPDGKDITVRGEVQGTLVFPPRGPVKFNYDSVFIPQGTSLTYAEMPLNQKQSLSHRSVAFQKLKDVLKQI